MCRYSWYVPSPYAIHTQLPPSGQSKSQWRVVRARVVEVRHDAGAAARIGTPRSMSRKLYSV